MPVIAGGQHFITLHNKPINAFCIIAIVVFANKQLRERQEAALQIIGKIVMPSSHPGPAFNSKKERHVYKAYD